MNELCMSDGNAMLLASMSAITLPTGMSLAGFLEVMLRNC